MGNMGGVSEHVLDLLYNTRGAGQRHRQLLLALPLAPPVVPRAAATAVIPEARVVHLNGSAEPFSATPLALLEL